MDSTVKLYSYNLSNARTYIFALLFIGGNILLPQLCHAVPQGGLMLLPIYFLTLVGAYKYGLHVGLITAVLSPVVNHLLFGMPAAEALAPILVKSTLLAVSAALIARRLRKVSLLGIALAVLIYQALGTVVEWAIKGDLLVAVQDFRIGIPGMLIQVFGGWLALKALARV